MNVIPRAMQTRRYTHGDLQSAELCEQRRIVVSSVRIGHLCKEADGRIEKP